MEENKEKLLADENTESVENCDAETKTEENTTEQTAEATAFGDELAELLDDANQPEDLNANYEFSAEQTEKQNEKPKKKLLLQPPVIISLFIVLAAALSLLVIKGFFDTSIVGTWSVTNTASADEAGAADIEIKTYFTFSDDGKVKMTQGTSENNSGTYKLSTNDDGNHIMSTDFIYGSQYGLIDFEYKVVGNIFTGKTLEIYVEGSKEPIELQKDKISVPKLEVSKDFKANDKLVGEWVYNYGYYKITYFFNADGTYKQILGDTVTTGVYTSDDKNIHITYYTYKETEFDLPYTINGKDEIVINNNLQLFRADSASADEVEEALKQYSQY